MTAHHLAACLGFTDAAALASLVLWHDIRRNLPAIVAALMMKDR